MANYFEANGNAGQVSIDDGFSNLSYIRKVSFTFKKDTGITYYSREITIDTTGVSNAVVAISSNIACTVVRETPTSFVIVVAANNKDGVANSVDLLNSASGYLHAYIFFFFFNVPANGVGLVCYNESGGVTYYSGFDYLNPVDMYVESNTYRPTIPSQYNIVNRALPAGRSYAFIPLFKLFTVYSEWVSGGQDTICMSSMCAIQGNTAILTSNAIYASQDLSAIYAGYCKHAYMFVDVTGY